MAPPISSLIGNNCGTVTTLKITKGLPKNCDIKKRPTGIISTNKIIAQCVTCAKRTCQMAPYAKGRGEKERLMRQISINYKAIKYKHLLYIINKPLMRYTIVN